MLTTLSSTVRRIYHHYRDWECVSGGMYETTAPSGMSPDSARQAYADFLSDLDRFEAALVAVISEWPVSCEQFLTNVGINRIAWLGQASMAIATGVPCVFRAGFKLLDKSQQGAANDLASRYLAKWIAVQGEDQLCLFSE